VPGHRIVASVYVETQAMRVRRDPRSCGRWVRSNLRRRRCAGRQHYLRAIVVYGAAIVGYADLRCGQALASIWTARWKPPPPSAWHSQITLEDPSEAAVPFPHTSSPRAIMQHPEFKLGFRQAGPARPGFDAAAFNHQLDDIAELAASFPDSSNRAESRGPCLGMGWNRRRPCSVFQAWRTVLFELAKRPNITCKIGGFACPSGALDTRSEPTRSDT